MAIMAALVMGLCGAGCAYYVFWSEARLRSRMVVLILYAGSWLIDWRWPMNPWPFVLQTLLCLYVVFYFQYIE